jgi:GTP pyrophosphokinase
VSNITFAFFSFAICLSMDELPISEIVPLVLPPGVSPALERRFVELEELVHSRRPKDDLRILRKAFEFGAGRHARQRRMSGELYMFHPLEVATILAGMQMDLVCLTTALLHDVIEDTDTTFEEVRRLFGEDVARCVNGVTKLSKINLASREDRQAESVRKMLLAMVEDIRVIVVKLADRLHNMRTLGSMPRDKQERIASETIELYAPIAHRLGMGKLRTELEDLGFRYLDPAAFEEVKSAIETKRQANEQVLGRDVLVGHLPGQLAGRRQGRQQLAGRLGCADGRAGRLWHPAELILHGLEQLGRVSADRAQQRCRRPAILLDQGR